MRIVDRRTFLALPAGVLFSKYEPAVLGELLIKGDTLNDAQGSPIDFWRQDIAGAVDFDSSDDLFDQLDRAQEGESVPMDFNVESRDGLYDANQLFAVWEAADIEALRERLAHVVPAVVSRPET